MTDDPPPGVSNRRSYKRVKALLRFGKGVASFSDSFAADSSTHNPSPDLDRSTAGTRFVPFGSPGVVSGRFLLSAPCSGYKRPKLPVAPLLTSLKRVEAPTCP